MSKAQELKALATESMLAVLRCARTYQEAVFDQWCEVPGQPEIRGAVKRELVEAKTALHAAIDAQQSIIDEQRAELERLTKQASAYQMLVKSLEDQRSHLRNGVDQAKEAASTLASEREANAILTAEIERLTKDAERLLESLGMFVARLENMQKNGDHWLTVVAVLALLNDCQYLAHLPAAAGSQTELTPADVCGNE